jgi:hypothetical protein
MKGDWNDQFSTQFDVYNTDSWKKAVNAAILEDSLHKKTATFQETGVKLKGNLQLGTPIAGMGHQG